MPERFVLRHAYVREGQSFPVDEMADPVEVIHAEGDREGTALHVWWVDLVADR